MLDGLHHVWRAAEVLAGGDAGLKERLKEARAHLLLALAKPDQWPPDLLSAARSIERIVREQDGIDPLEAMPPDLGRQVAEDLLSLAVDVQALFPRGWCKETAPSPQQPARPQKLAGSRRSREGRAGTRT
jgi:hypothetical protein